MLKFILEQKWSGYKFSDTPIQNGGHFHVYKFNRRVMAAKAFLSNHE